MPDLETPTAAETSQAKSTDDIGAVLLSRIRARTDSLVDNLPPGRIDAKRMIEGSLEIDLRAEELQSVEAIAGDKESKGAFRELPRSALALRVLVDRQLKSISSDQIDPQVLRSAKLLLSIALDQRGRLEDTLRKLLEFGSEQPPELQRLSEVCEILLPQRQPIVAALVLIPRLEELTAVARMGDPCELAPSLDAAEVAMLRAAALGQKDGEAPVPRVCLDAVVLRTIIEDDLQQWSRLAAEDGNEGVLCKRREVFRRFTRDRLAHEVVTAYLQSGQDAALKACDDASAAAIRNARGKLFPQYLKLVPILRRGPSAVTDLIVEDTPAISEATTRLISESADVDKESERLARTQVSEEEIYLEALKRSKQGQTASPVFSGADQLRQTRRRLRGLYFATVALFIVAVVVQIWSFKSRDVPNRIAVTRSEFTRFLPVTSVKAIGAMLYARVDGWEDYNTKERLRRAGEVGNAAAAKGFGTVYLVDTAGEALARWSIVGGVELEEGPARE